VDVKDIEASRRGIHLDGVSEDIDTAQNALASVAAELYVLGSHDWFPLNENGVGSGESGVFGPGSADHAEDVELPS